MIWIWRESVPNSVVLSYSNKILTSARFMDPAEWKMAGDSMSGSSGKAKQRLNCSGLACCKAASKKEGLFVHMVCMLNIVAGLLPHPPPPRGGLSLARVQNTSSCAKTSTELFSLFKYSRGNSQMIFEVP